MSPGFRCGSAWVQGPAGADDNGRRSFLKLGAAAAGSVLAGAGAKAAEPGAPPADANGRCRWVRESSTVPTASLRTSSAT